MMTTGNTQTQHAARVTKNTGLLLLADAGNILFGLISVPLMARYLGVEIYGQYVFLLSLIKIFISIPDFGLRRIIMREVTNAKHDAALYWGTVIIFQGILTGLIVVGVAITLWLLGMTGQYAAAALCLLLGEIALIYFNSCMSVFFAFEKMRYNTIFMFVTRGAGLAAILAVVLTDAGFIALTVAIALPNIALFLLGYAQLVKKIGPPQFTQYRGQWRLFLKESFPLFVEMIFKRNTLRIDVFVLKALRGPSEVALFYIPYGIILRLQMLPVAFITALFPSLTRFADTSKTRLEQAFVRAFTLLLLLSLPLAMSMSILAEQFILILFGEAYLDAAIAFQLLTWVLLFIFVDPLISTVLVSLNKQSFSALLQVAACGENLLLDLLLVPKFGFQGACIGSLITYVTRFVLSAFYLSKHGVQFHPGKTLPKPLFSGAVMGITLYFSRSLPLLVSLAVGLCAFIAALFAFGTLSRDDLALMKSALARKRRPNRLKQLETEKEHHA